MLAMMMIVNNKSFFQTNTETKCALLYIYITQQISTLFVVKGANKVEKEEYNNKIKNESERKYQM
jgi:hypothetical protein